MSGRSRYDDLDALMARMDSSLDDQIAPPLKSTLSLHGNELFSSGMSTRAAAERDQQRHKRSSTHTRSMPSSPSVSNGLHPIEFALPSRSDSQLKLQPRSARNQRTDTEDFDFLVAAPRLAKSSSTRSAKLRQDLEQVADKLRQRSVSSGGSSSTTTNQSSRPSGLAIAGAPDVLGSPLPSPGLVSSSKLLAPPSEKDDVRSLSPASVHSIGSAGATWTAAANALRLTDSPSRLSSPGGRFSARSRHSGEYSPELEIRARPTPKEPREWSQSCWTWHSSSSSSGSSRSAPLIRDVPSALKRKMGKRESSHDIASLADERVKPKMGLFSSSRSKAATTSIIRGPTALNRDGYWRASTSVLREDGHLRLYNEDKVLEQSVHLPSCLRTDLRIADTSLFGLPHVVALHRRSSNPRKTPGSSTTTANAIDEPIYLRFTSCVALETWTAMALCFARPEFYHSDPSGQFRLDMPAYDAAPDSPGSASTRCRIFRRIALSIIEGRGVGETHAVESPAREKRFDDAQSTASSARNASSDIRSISSSGDRSLSRAEAGSTFDLASKAGSSSAALDVFVEIVLDGVVVARTAARHQTTSPVWNESFSFSDLPSVVQPLVLNVYAIKSGKPILLGTADVSCAGMPRGVTHEYWVPIRGAGAKQEFLGDLSVSVLVEEEAVLPNAQYSQMLTALLNDHEADLALDLAIVFSTQLEDMVHLLLRIYYASSALLPRLFRLADVEMGESVDANATTLFRGNSILTKSIELYLRLVGPEYLEASLGDVVRRLSAERVDIEIDPSKMKANVKEKVVEKSVQELHTWTMSFWTAIYDARHKCPNDVRLIFQHIQQVAARKYSEEQQKRIKSTAVSAFAFLRFFVPAILNPKLFGLVAVAPDPKAQRALTLIAKTLQGLANFATFGHKEPWMYHMNDFVQDNTNSFVDFIDYISTPSSSSSPSIRNEWTDPNASVYLSARNLADSLPIAAREGVPTLPHLIDLPRNLGQLASRVALKGSTTAIDAETDSESVARRGLSSKYYEFKEACIRVHEESKRRGEGLIASEVRRPSLVKTSFLSRAHRSDSTVPTALMRRSSLADYASMIPSTGSMDDLFAKPSSESLNRMAEEGAAPTKRESNARHQANRNVVVTGLSPTRNGGVRPTFQGHSSSFSGASSTIEEDQVLYASADNSEEPSSASATDSSFGRRTHSGAAPFASRGDAFVVPPTSASSTSQFFGIPRSISMMPTKSGASIASSASSLSIVADVLGSLDPRRKSSSAAASTYTNTNTAASSSAGGDSVAASGESIDGDRPRRRSLWRMTGSYPRSKPSTTTKP